MTETSRTPGPVTPALPTPGPGDWLSVAALVLLAAGLLATLTGLASGNRALVVIGGIPAAAALTALIAIGAVSGLTLLVISLPLPALFSDEFARITPAAILTAVVIAAWFLANAAGSRRLRAGRLPRGAIAAFLAAVALSTIFAQHTGAALRELTNLALMMGLLVVATDELTRRPDRVTRLAGIVAGVAAVTGVFAALEAFGIVGGRFTLAGTSLYRATAGFGWPNELGMFMAVALPLAIHVYRSATSPGAKAMAGGAVAAATVGLLLTFSRGSWLAVAAAAPVLLLTGDRRFTLKLVAGAGVAVVALDVALGGVLVDRATGVFTDPYVIQRLALMLAGVLMFQAHPIVGVGPGGYAESLGEYGPRVPWLWDYVGSSHNAYLEVAAETGILGFAAFVALLGTLFIVLLKSARRARADTEPGSDAHLRRALLWSFATVCAVSFTVWPFAHGAGQLVVLVAAMGIAMDAKKRGADRGGAAVAPGGAP